MKPQKQDIISAIKTIYDPEIPVNIWDLGLIYDIVAETRDVEIIMTFTSPSCPMMEELIAMVKQNVESVTAVDSVNINLVWDPPWDISMMSKEARLTLDLTEQGW